VGVSNERPTGEAGMIRYLTSDNIIEYYNANTGSGGGGSGTTGFGNGGSGIVILRFSSFA
jgi:hypothetical protein